LAITEQNRYSNVLWAGGKGGPPVSHKRFPLSGSLGRSKSAGGGTMQSAGGGTNITSNISVVDVINAAGMTAYYGDGISGIFRLGYEFSRTTDISSYKYVKGINGAFAKLGVFSSAADVVYNGASTRSLVKLGVNVSINVLNAVPFAGTVLSIGAGAFELSGGLDTFYNQFSNTPLVNY